MTLPAEPRNDAYARNHFPKDGVERAMTRQVRAAWIEAGPITMNGGAATRAFDNWLASVRAETLQDYADELDAIYPVTVWPETTGEQLVQLHAFARSIGLPDGSLFHVGGIRHARTLMRAEANRIESDVQDTEGDEK